MSENPTGKDVGFGVINRVAEFVGIGKDVTEGDVGLAIAGNAKGVEVAIATATLGVGVVD